MPAAALATCGCENCNKQKEVLGKQAMQYIDYVECFPNGVYQNSPGHDDVTKPDQICEGYTSAWPLWVVPKDLAADGSGQDEIGIQGQIKKPNELVRLVKVGAVQVGNSVYLHIARSAWFPTLEPIK